jgi:hypothetical protein
MCQEASMACKKDHSGSIPRKPIEALEESQAGFWRHRCAGCAYELGRKDAGEAEERLRNRVRELQDELDRLQAKSVKAGK